jgi:hypothetical protein
MIRRCIPLLLAVLFAGFWAVMAFVPADSIRTPGCQVRKWTGVNCPGCGGTRAARHLVQGRFRKAARSNVFIYPVTAAVLWGMVALIANRWAGKHWWTPERISGRVAIWLLLILAVFTLVRNLEFGWFLRP